MEVERNKVFEVEKISENTFAPLKIQVYNNEEDSWIILYNKYLLLIKDKKTSDTRFYNFTNFHIKETYLIHNAIFCRDYENNLHCSNLKFGIGNGNLMFKIFLKNVQKVCIENDRVDIFLSHGNLIKLQTYSIIGKTKMKFIKIVSIKNESSVNFFDSDFTTAVKSVSYFSSTFLRKLLNIDTLPIDLESKILFLSHANSLYYSLLWEDSPKLLKLNSYSVSIQNFRFEQKLCSMMYAVLVTGNLVATSYDFKNEVIQQNTVHLNSSVTKSIFDSNWIVYTDKSRLWQTNFSIVDDKVLTVSSKYKIENISDIAYDSKKDIFYCTNVYNNLYTFSYKYNKIPEESMPKDEFLQIPKSMKECHRVTKRILEETHKNEVTLKEIIKENDYMVALAFKRNPIPAMKNISINVKILEDMSEVDVNSSHFLTANKYDYYEKNTQICQVTFSFSKEFKKTFEDMLKTEKNMWHATAKLIFPSGQNVSTCIAMKSVDPFSMLVPFKSVDSFLTITTNLVGLIPDVHLENHYFWSVFATKDINVDSSYFVRRLKNELLGKRKIEDTSLQKSVQELKLKRDPSRANSSEKIGTSIESFYVRLPTNFLKITNVFAERLSQNSGSSQSIVEEIVNPNFIKHGKAIKFSLCGDYIELIIEKLFGDKLRLKISGPNLLAVKSFYIHTLDVLQCLRDEKLLDEKPSIDYYDFVILKSHREELDSLTHSEENPEMETLKTILNKFKKDVMGKLSL